MIFPAINKYRVLVTLVSISFLWGYDSVSNTQLLADNLHTSTTKKVADKSKGKAVSLKVTATAYTSSVIETDSTPNLTAWGDKLKPGMKAIAVSRDLIKLGLRHKAKVTIEGLEGVYIVRDKMHRKWKKKIDIYMGNNRKRAINWGKRKVIIHWVR